MALALHVQVPLQSGVLQWSNHSVPRNSHWINARNLLFSGPNISWESRMCWSISVKNSLMGPPQSMGTFTGPTIIRELYRYFVSWREYFTGYCYLCSFPHEIASSIAALTWEASSLSASCAGFIGEQATGWTWTSLIFNNRSIFFPAGWIRSVIFHFKPLSTVSLSI